MGKGHREERGGLLSKGDVGHMRCVSNVGATLTVLNVRRVLEEFHKAEIITADHERLIV